MCVPPLKRILYVEDDPDIQAVAKIALCVMGGLEVQICSTGREALALAPIFSPDLILLDVMLPEMDGLETLKALRQVPDMQATPVVFMTARLGAQEVAGYLEAGALDVIPKPFEAVSLAQRVEALWRRHHG